MLNIIIRENFNKWKLGINNNINYASKKIS